MHWPKDGSNGLCQQINTARMVGVRHARIMKVLSEGSNFARKFCRGGPTLKRVFFSDEEGREETNAIVI